MFLAPCPFHRYPYHVYELCSSCVMVRYVMVPHLHIMVNVIYVLLFCQLVCHWIWGPFCSNSYGSKNNIPMNFTVFTPRPRIGHSYGGGPHRTLPEYCGSANEPQMSCWELIAFPFTIVSHILKLRVMEIPPYTFNLLMVGPDCFYSGGSHCNCQDSILGPLNPKLSPLTMLPRLLHRLSS